MNCAVCGNLGVVGTRYCQDCGQRLPHDPPAAFVNVAAVSIGPVAPESNGAVGNGAASNGSAPWGTTQIVLGIVIVLVLLFAAAGAAAGIATLYSAQEDAVATWISVHLTAIAIIGTVWFFGLRHCQSPLSAIGLDSFSMPAKRAFLLAAAVLAASLIITSVYALLVSWWGIGFLEPPDLDSGIAFDGAAVLLTFQALALMTPITEEVFFRGFIFGGLLRRVGPRWAIIISALVFSAFHLSLGVFIPIFITGVLFAWLYWRTGSLWAAIAAHAGQNALAVGFGILG